MGVGNFYTNYKNLKICMILLCVPQMSIRHQLKYTLKFQYSKDYKFCGLFEGLNENKVSFSKVIVNLDFLM